MYDKKPKKVSFDDNLKFCYSDVIYKNGIPLFFNLQNNWFFYDFVTINNVKLKFLI